MMPLMLAGIGEENTIKKIGGSPEIKKHLEDLGFVVGVISSGTQQASISMRIVFISAILNWNGFLNSSWMVLKNGTLLLAMNSLKQ